MQRYILIFLITLLTGSAMAQQGLIILEQQTPPTEVIITATEQVILKPGFHAIGSVGTFNAKIGSENSMSPVIPMAAGSTAVIPTIPIISVEPAVASLDQNYVVSTVAYKEVTDATALNETNSNTAIQYFDGLGRPTQTVQHGITPSGADLVMGIEYDGIGRDFRHWLPGVAAGNGGAYVSDFGAKAINTANAANPYVETILESSPLNRPLGQRQPGADWYTHPTGIDYKTNDAGEVIYFSVSNNQLKQNGNYDPNTLYKTIVTDEDKKTTTEFKDKLGQVVLKRGEEGGHVDTYYVYNDLSQLSYVIPPKAVDELTDFSDDNAIMKQYCYLYQYDERGNCIYKRLPGCEPILMVYDKAYRLILSQDGNQRTKSPAQWTVTKYDQLGRVISAGLTNSITASHTELINSYKNDLVVETFNSGAYTNNKFSDATPLTISYYDTYGFISILPTEIKTGLTYADREGYDTPYPQSPPSGDLGILNAKGLLTGTRVCHLDNPSLFETTALYYDKYARVVQSRSTNHLGGYDIAYNALDFTGKPTKTLKNHNIAGQASVVELYTYDYDKAQRPTTTKYSLNGGSLMTMAVNTYDELGRLSSKKLGGIDATTYSYNIRSWITDISGSRFSENLYYNVNPLSSNVCFNGNVSGMQWDVPNEGIGYKRAYNFVYDGLNRLTDANYCGFNGSVVAGTSDRYNEHFGFDKMGNITNFARNGLQANNSTMIYGKVDDLVLEHTGNQLMKVTDTGGNGVFYGDEEFVRNTTNSGNSCAYDANGNRLYDSNSNIWGIKYNILNLPDALQFYQGHQTNYTYSATGAKLKVIDKTAPAGAELPVTSLNTVLTNPSVAMTTTTDYVGNMIYENGTLKRILTSVGYWEAGTYYYFLKDHLGSNRVVMTGSGAIAETSSYYPSGMRFGESAVNGGSVQPYRHTGHEMQEMHGLNWIDNGARFRTVSDGGGLPTVDPLAEKYYSISPYVYCAGNPINALDPNGMDVYILNTKGQYILALKTEDNHDNLYALDKSGHLAKTKDGTLKRQTVSDKTIMSSLKWKKGNDSNSSVTSNATDAFNVFKFSADNSENEWSLSGFKDHGKTKFFLNTEYDNSGASTGEGSVFQAKDMLFNLHDHPSEEGAKGGSGYNIEPQLTSNGNWKYVLKSRDIPSDAYTSKALYDNTGRVMPMYVYYPHSNELYKYTPWNGNNRTWSNVNSVMILQRIIYPK